MTSAVQATVLRVPGAPDTASEYREMRRSITHAQYALALTLESLQAAQPETSPTA